MTVGELEVAIQEALSKRQSPFEANRFRVSDLRHSLNEFFDELEERPSKSHGTVLVMDADESQEASFVVVTVSTDAVELAFGHGDAEELHGAAARELLERCASDAIAIKASRQTLIAWSGYDPE